MHKKTKRTQRTHVSAAATVAEPQRSQRFAEKQADIMAAATVILLTRGLKGFTLAEVAERTGLITQGVSYYFPKKDDLAAACILDTVARLRAVVERALESPTPEGRISAFYRGYMEMLSRIAAGDEPWFAPLDEVRVLNESNYARVVEALVGMFRRLRQAFDSPQLAWMGRRERTARTALIMQIALSVPAWEYSRVGADYVRSGERMIDIVLKGLAPRRPAHWPPPELPHQPLLGDVGARDGFLRAASALINEQGYRGASVVKISNRLNVSKGAFYHHNEAKDDVVVGCFERTIELVTNTQLAAETMEVSGWDRLAAAAKALAELQLSDEGPLLRTTAVYALPTDAAPRIARQWDRVIHRFTGMISDAIADGTVRAVDPIVAGNLIMVSINSAAELSAWLPDVRQDEIAELYVRPLFAGVLAR